MTRTSMRMNGQTRIRLSGRRTRREEASAATAEPAMPPSMPPVTNRPTSLLAWYGWMTSLTAIQNWVTAMAMKTSAQKQKTSTGMIGWLRMNDWSQMRKKIPEVSATGVWNSFLTMMSNTYQKTHRQAMKDRSEAVR